MTAVPSLKMGDRVQNPTLRFKAVGEVQRIMWIGDESQMRYVFVAWGPPINERKWEIPHLLRHAGEDSL